MCAGYKDIVDYLLEKKADVNIKDRWGATPLDDCQDEELSKLLLSHGAQPSPNKQTQCAIPDSLIGENDFRLIYAAHDGDLLLMQRLCLIGWKVNAFDYDGRTALLVAVS